MWTPQLHPDLPRFRAIAEALASDIESGALPVGTRLPPQRDLARALGVAIGTVTRAYSLAEDRGLVRGEVGRGTYVGSHPDRLPFGDTGESATGGINLAMNWPLDGLNPDLSPVLARLSREGELDPLLRYQPNLGLARHRAAGARWIEGHGHRVDPDRIALCCGGQHAIAVALSALARTGDTILAEELTYPGLRAAADFLGLKVCGVAMDHEGVIPDALDQACRSRRPKALYCTPTQHNPTTATQSTRRRAELVEVTRRHGVAILEDAIHQLLPEDPPAPVASLAPESTYLIASPSKVVAPGLRIAYLAAPAEAQGCLSQRLWTTTWMAPPLAAEVLTRWIEDGTAQATVAAKREELRVRNTLARELLPAAHLRTSATGLHAWLDLPRPWRDSSAFVQAAQARGVALSSSHAFHVGLGSPAAGARLSLCAPRERGVLRRGLEQVAALLAEPVV